MFHIVCHHLFKKEKCRCAVVTKVSYCLVSSVAAGADYVPVLWRTLDPHVWIVGGTQTEIPDENNGRIMTFCAWHLDIILWFCNTRACFNLDVG